MELKILHWFEELHNPVLDFLMYQITCLGNGGLIWLVIAAAMLFVLPKRYRKTGATVVAALLISLVICNGIMKNLYQRVRPFHADCPAVCRTEYDTCQYIGRIMNRQIQS